MLILFDIDATLISTSGVGIRAMEDAAAELFGEGFRAPTVEYAGRLDPLIIGDLFRASGRAMDQDGAARFRRAYGGALARRLDDPTVVRRALPGVEALLGRLRGADGVTLGLLTGNFAETGSIKLRACGIDPAWFDIAVWGDASPHDPPDRADLPPIAMSCQRARTGREADPARVTIVGDTPHDVRCARAHGCRSLAVATGRFNVGELEAAGASRVVRDLSGTDEVAAWLTTA